MSAHSRFGGSVMARIIACPGSVKLCEGMPNPESPFAAEGTMLHDIAAEALVNWRDSNLTTDEFAAKTNALTEEQRDVVGMFTNFVRTEVDLLDMESEATLLVEQRFALDHLHPEFFGTADVVIYNANSLRVVDLKCGRGVDVQADYNGEVNPQLAFYALGVLHMLGGEFPDIEVVIVQPRAGGIKRRAVTMQELTLMADKFLLAATIADIPNPPVMAGSHCKFCIGKVRCPAMQEAANRSAVEDFTDTAPQSLHGEDLQAALQRADLLEMWVKAVREHAFLELHSGKPVPGYKLVEKLGNRKWRDESETVSVLNKTNIGAAMYDQKLKSVAQMEKTLKTMGLDKKILESLTERSASATLAPESDGRPEARSGAAADFTTA